LRRFAHLENDDPLIVSTALQEQLGLKLEPKKVPMAIVVIDHAGKAPIEN
jgi:uncharacterized protein (TIGR03435 family)